MTEQLEITCWQILKPEERRCFCNAVIPQHSLLQQVGHIQQPDLTSTRCKRALCTNSKAHSWDLSGFLQVVTLLVILKEVKNWLGYFA